MPGLEEVTSNSIVLGEHETTGLLPVGFEFERYGTRYDRFDVSTDGFVTFGRGGRHGGAGACLRLADEEPGGIGNGRLSYEVRGNAPRRRLLISFRAAPGGVALQVVVYERTGIVELCRTVQSLGEPTIRQLDMAQPSPTWVNSARKIG
jgi:hypothetical protein